MANLGLIVGGKTAVMPSQQPGQNPKRDGAPQGAEAAFGALLVTVEDMAAKASQIVTLGNGLAGLSEGQADPASMLAHNANEAAGQATGQDPAAARAMLRMKIEALSRPASASADAASKLDGQAAKGANFSDSSAASDRSGGRGPRPNAPVPGGQPAAGAAPLTPAQAAALAAFLGADEPARVSPQELGHLALDAAASEKTAPQNSGADGVKAAKPLSEQSSAVVRQVSSGLQFVVRGEAQRLRLDLHPAELGRVQIQMQKTGTVTRVVVVAETAQAFEALKSGATGLQQTLAQAGFETDELRFEQDGERGESFDDRRSDADDQREHHQRRRALREFTEDRRELLVQFDPPRAASRNVIL